MDNQLNWKHQIAHLSSKLSKTIGILSKTRKYLGHETLMTLYYAFMYPYLLYGNIVWGNASATTLWPAFRLQKMAVRMIFNIKRRQSTSPSFKNGSILKLPDIYTYSATLFMFKFHNGKLPGLFNDFFTTNSSIHSHGTRQKDQLNNPLFKTQIGNKSIRKTGPIAWNIIIKMGQATKKIGLIKRMTRTVLLEQY